MCCYNQVSLGKAEEVLQMSATGASSSLKLFHSVAALTNLNRNGIACLSAVFFICLVHSTLPDED